MCNPMAAMVAVTVVSGAMQYSGQRKQARFQEKMGKQNMLIKKRMAEDAIERGNREEARHRLRVRQMASEQTAKMSALGLDVSSGSAANVLSDTATMGELDALTIRENARREAWGHTVGGQQAMMQGELDAMGSRNRATGTLLTTAGTVAGQWYGYNQDQKLNANANGTA